MAKEIKNTKKQKRQRRHARVRAHLSGTSERPRLSVFKSNRYLYVQLIDDSKGATLLTGSTKTAKGKTMLEKALVLGKEIAHAAQSKKIEAIVFDRGGYLYAGKIKAIAEALRSGGLRF